MTRSNALIWSYCLYRSLRKHPPSLSLSRLVSSTRNYLCFPGPLLLWGGGVVLARGVAMVSRGVAMVSRVPYSGYCICNIICYYRVVSTSGSPSLDSLSDVTLSRPRIGWFVSRDWNAALWVAGLCHVTGIPLCDWSPGDRCWRGNTSRVIPPHCSVSLVYYSLSYF